jgi:hypothetical protein
MTTHNNLNIGGKVPAVFRKKQMVQPYKTAATGKLLQLSGMLCHNSPNSRLKAQLDFSGGDKYSHRHKGRPRWLKTIRYGLIPSLKHNSIDWRRILKNASTPM